MFCGGDNGFADCCGDDGSVADDGGPAIALGESGDGGFGDCDFGGVGDCDDGAVGGQLGWRGVGRFGAGAGLHGGVNVGGCAATGGVEVRDGALGWSGEGEDGKPLGWSIRRSLDVVWGGGEMDPRRNAARGHGGWGDQLGVGRLTESVHPTTFSTPAEVLEGGV